LKQDILDYYSDPNAANTTTKHGKEWAQVVKDLAVLRSMPGVVPAGN
jgi:hypothetical protein